MFLNASLDTATNLRLYLLFGMKSKMGVKDVAAPTEPLSLESEAQQLKRE